MVEDRQGGSDRRRPRRSAPRTSGPDRARRTQPKPDGEAPRPQGPPIPAEIEAKQLSPEIRGELTTLDRATADVVARHLVAAGELIDADPEAALAHARAARARSGRIAAVREAVGIAAYHCGDWAQALAELRAARRMGSKSPLLALIADCERGVGRPERAIELARTPEAAQLTGDDADELRIVVAGARSDLGQHEQALAELRAARRMGSKSPLLPLIADCERGVGRPERAIELARTPEAAVLTGDGADELRIVVAGARSDLGQHEQALAILSTPQLDPARTGQTAARLFYAYAETLLALGRNQDALQWFIKAAAADGEGVTDAEERITELA